MKKITALLLSLAMILSLSACGEKKEETTSITETTAVTTKATTKATTQTTTITTQTTTTVQTASYDVINNNGVCEFKDICFDLCETDNAEEYKFMSFYGSPYIMCYHDNEIIGRAIFEIYELNNLEAVKLMLEDKIRTYNNYDSSNQIDMKINDIDVVKINYPDYGNKINTYIFNYNNNVYIINFSVNSDYCDKCSIYTKSDEMIETLRPIKENNNNEINNQHSEETIEETTDKKDEDVSLGKLNALESAKSYIEYSGFSYNELIGQLEYEKYSSEEAKYGADNCGADWNEEALESAKSYIEYSGFSYSGLYDQLLYEEFTEEQAQYGVDNCGADWMEEAAECAQSYIDYSSFSRQELYDQLIYEGFTDEQAEHGVTAVGY